MPSPKETGGPIVKTGPTSGDVRSRNKNGQWRKKRSDAGVPRGTSSSSSSSAGKLFADILNILSKR